MSKKELNVGAGLDSLIGYEKPKTEKAESRGPGRPKGTDKEEEDIVTSFLMKPDLHDKLKASAYWDRITIKEALETALNEYFKDKNIKPRPLHVREEEKRKLDRKRKQGETRLSKY